jgi:uroporphyrinogen-III decarboxylase
VEQLDWELVADRAKQIDYENWVVSGFCEMGIFERIYLLMGMENALCAFITDTEEIEALAEAIADYKVNLIDRMCNTVKLDMVWYGDDWGTQNNLFISPGLWRKIIKPATQKIYDCLKRHDVFINQHSCGVIEDIFGDVVEIGAQMWNPCQPCNNLAGLKRKYGDKISFFGGIDSQFVLDNPWAGTEEVRKEVKKRIREMNSPYGGYVAAPSHSVPYDPDKLKAMTDAIERYGKMK